MNTIGQDWADYERSIAQSVTDCEEIGIDAIGWAEPEVSRLAGEAASALRELLDEIGAAYNRIGPDGMTRRTKPS